MPQDQLEGVQDDHGQNEDLQRRGELERLSQTGGAHFEEQWGYEGGEEEGEAMGNQQSAHPTLLTPLTQQGQSGQADSHLYGQYGRSQPGKGYTSTGQEIQWLDNKSMPGVVTRPPYEGSQVMGEPRWREPNPLYGGGYQMVQEDRTIERGDLTIPMEQWRLNRSQTPVTSMTRIPKLPPRKIVTFSKERETLEEEYRDFLNRTGQGLQDNPLYRDSLKGLLISNPIPILTMEAPLYVKYYRSQMVSTEPLRSLQLQMDRNPGGTGQSSTLQDTSRRTPQPEARLDMLTPCTLEGVNLSQINQRIACPITRQFVTVEGSQYISRGQA